MKKSPMPPRSSELQRSELTRSGELDRSSRLERRTALRRVALIVKARRPSAAWIAVRRVVWARCGGRCERCGVALQAGRWPCHHRKGRGRGGLDQVVNAVALCSDCHTAGPQAVHRREVPAAARGLMLRRHQDPAAEPVRLHDGRRVLLTPAGAYAPVLTNEES